MDVFAKNTNNVTISEGIDRATGETIKKLLGKHNEEYGTLRKNVIVTEHKMKMLCPSCSHKCDATEYRATGFTKILIDYSSCDCGYAKVRNWYGMSLICWPGTKPRIQYSSDASEFLYVTYEKAQKIMESKLIVRWEDEERKTGK